MFLSCAPTLPGTVDLGLAFRPTEESMDVVAVFAFPELGGGGEGIALGDSKWHIPLRRCGIQCGPLRLAASLQGYLPV